VRSLVENYFISTQPAGWRCSECGLVFLSRNQAKGDPPREVLIRFERHSCNQHIHEHKLHVIVNKYKASEKRSLKRKDEIAAIISGSTERAEKSTIAVETSRDLIVKTRESIETSKRRRKKTL